MQSANEYAPRRNKKPANSKGSAVEFGFALVPVLAGYWLLTRTHFLKHPYESKTHHRVIFEPAIAGGVLLVVSWILASVLADVFAGDWPIAGGPIVGAGWHKIAPFDHAGVLALTIVLATTIPPVINWKVDAVTAANRWAVVNETSRGRLLRESLEKGHLVEVSLSDGQFHVGIVYTSPRSEFEGDVFLAPELSGYRDPQTQKLIITTAYEDQDPDIRIVSLLEKVVSISYFDLESRYVEWAIP